MLEVICMAPQEQLSEVVAQLAVASKASTLSERVGGAAEGLGAVTRPGTGRAGSAPAIRAIPTRLRRFGVAVVVAAAVSLRKVMKVLSEGVCEHA
ncbi:hypothetical protein VM98_37460, partial [Streptomyces rubellomurinus subsp. indigoferus]